MRFITLLFAALLLAAPAHAGTVLYKDGTPAIRIDDTTKAVDLRGTFKLGGTTVITPALDYLKGNGLYVTATNGTASRTIEAHFSDKFYAKNFTGITCDGSTDDTTGIQTALDALHTAFPEGVKLVFSRGTCIASQVKLYRQQIISCGDGVQACILKQKTGSNRDFIISENFATLTGTGNNYGTDANVPSWFGIEDMHIDGNASNQSSGRCIAWYGNAILMRGHNFIKNCYDDNIYTEASGSFAYSATDWKSQEEGFIEYVESRNSAHGWGWRMRGPHDTVVTSYIATQNALGGLITQTSGSTYVGLMHAIKVHTYANTGGIGQRFEAGGTTIDESYNDFDNLYIAGGTHIAKLKSTACGYQSVNCVTITANGDFTNIGQWDYSWYTSATGGVIGLDVQTGADSVYVGSANGSVTPPSGTVTAVKWRGSFGYLNHRGGNSTTSGSACNDWGGTYNTFIWSGFGCKTAVNYTVGGHNHMTIQHFHSSGETDLNLVSGFVAQGDRIHFSNDVRSYETIGGQLVSVGDAPTVGTCGTSPSISGTDTKGVVTTGTGAPTACTVTFAHAYASAPVCTAVTSDTTATPTISAVSTSAVTFTLAAGLTSGKIYYHCIQ